ncbi:MAG: hypothetical protein II249_07195 [Bacteroidaceae bacterium]|nr:hypothetical protein [Bacteroidaceae bacterium]
MERTQRSSVLYINNARLHCLYIPNGVGLLFLLFIFSLAFGDARISMD